MNNDQFPPCILLDACRLHLGHGTRSISICTRMVLEGLVFNKFLLLRSPTPMRIEKLLACLKTSLSCSPNESKLRAVEGRSRSSLDFLGGPRQLCLREPIKFLALIVSAHPERRNELTITASDIVFYFVLQALPSAIRQTHMLSHSILGYKTNQLIQSTSSCDVRCIAVVLQTST